MIKSLPLWSLLLLVSANAAGANIDQKKAKEIFSQKVHPFMRQNCAECHSERAVKPRGPDHSHADPAIAFSKFSAFVNWDNPDSSRAMRLVMSRHFCTDYGYNCQQADRVVQEYQGLLREYVSSVKQSSLIGRPPEGSSGRNGEESPATDRYRITVQGVERSRGVYEFDLKAISRGEPMLKAEFKAFAGGYSQLESLQLRARGGIFAVRGIQLLVNGQPLSAQTGLESLDRTLTFESSFFPSSQTLSLVRPLIKLSSGDRLEMVINEARELARFPARLCSDKALALPSPARDHVIESAKTITPVKTQDPKELCYNAEAQVDIRNPRRSVLLAFFSSKLLDAIESWVASYDPDLEPEAANAVPQVLEGERLFKAAGCANCHSMPGSQGLGGGAAIVTDFGKFYAPNISPDSEYGIGKWTDVDFLKAMREGVRPADGALYYPVFPFRSYTKMSDQDLLAIKEYLFSLPKVRQKSRDHELAFLYRWRSAVAGWRMLNFPAPSGNPDVDIKVASGPFTKDRSRTASWNRGAYLVEGVAHCTECHTPRNSTGGLVLDKWMTGSPNTPTGKGAPNLKTLGWSQAQWETFLSSGFTPTGKAITGEMAAVIEGLDLLSPADRSAMAEYLRSFGN